MIKSISNLNDAAEFSIGCLKQYLAGKRLSVPAQRKFAERITKGQAPKVVCRLLKILSEDGSWFSRNFSCFILPYCFQGSKHKADIQEILLRLAKDKDWRVRESITWTFYRLLKDNFENVFPMFINWSTHSNEHIRRAIVIAAMKMGKHREEKYKKPLLNLVQIFLTDKSKRVQKAIIFALGDGFLRYYPLSVFACLRGWIKKSEAKVHRIIAMSFRAAEARRHVEQCMEILKELSYDGSGYLHNAVVGALKNLAQEYPEKVIRQVRMWHEERQQAHVAETILKEIKEKVQSKEASK